MADPPVSCPDEVDGSASKLSVGVNVLWNSWWIKIVEWNEKLHAQVVVGHKVLQQEEVDVAADVFEEREKVGIAL